jgi:chorismate dehydratase
LNPLRIGCVKYLNARPLIRGWPGNVEFDHPSALCQRLAESQLDVALVSSFEFLRRPIYRIVDDVSISSDGPVYSVIVAYRGEVLDIEEIELDPASETSANLLRCLIGERALTPRLSRNIGLELLCPSSKALPADSASVQLAQSETAENISAGRTGTIHMFQAAHRARLLIGDQAIQFRQKYAGEFQFWDLGEQWKKLTGLPFVYALWLIRPEVEDAESVALRLRQLRDRNLADLGDLIAEAVGSVGHCGNREMSREFVARYYSKYLRFSFGVREKQGLHAFARLCAKHGLLPNCDPVFGVV